MNILATNKRTLNRHRLLLYKTHLKKFCEGQPKKWAFSKLKKFGKFGLIFYTSYVCIAFAGFYILLETKLIKLEKVIQFTEKYGVNKYIDIRKKVDEYPKMANIVTAYLLNQIFEIIRLPTTILFLTYYFKKYKK